MCAREPRVILQHALQPALATRPRRRCDHGQLAGAHPAIAGEALTVLRNFAVPLPPDRGVWPASRPSKYCPKSNNLPNKTIRYLKTKAN
jgi:hypothetical protein